MYVVCIYVCLHVLSIYVYKYVCVYLSIYINRCICTYKYVRGWAKNHPAFALRLPRSIVPPFQVYPTVNATFLMEPRTSLTGRHGSRVVPLRSGQLMKFQI
jgi:hypothetical protein